MVGNDELLAKHGHIKFNLARTVQQAWDKLNSTPYHTSKASQYRLLRQLMLDEEVKANGRTN